MYGPLWNFFYLPRITSNSKKISIQDLSHFVMLDKCWTVLSFFELQFSKFLFLSLQFNLMWPIKFKFTLVNRKGANSSVLNLLLVLGLKRESFLTWFP